MSKIDNDKYDEGVMLEPGFCGSTEVVTDSETGEKFAKKQFYKDIYEEEDENDFTEELSDVLSVSFMNLVPIIAYSVAEDENTGEVHASLLYPWFKNGSAARAVSPKPSDSKPFTQTIITKILFGVAKCLQYLHSKGISHHDLHVNNVLIDDNYEPHVSDILFFSLERGDSDTVRYWTAPEQFEEEDGSKHADSYSYGMLVYYLLTKKKPFENVSTPLELIDKVVTNKEIPDVSTLPANVQTFLKKCWSYKPENRPTFDEIVEFIGTQNLGLQIKQDEFDAYKNKFNIDSTVKQDSGNKLQQLAESGNPTAQFLYGYKLEGQGKINDAVKYYKLSADQKDDYGCFKYGMCMFLGQGIEIDKIKALEYFTQASLSEKIPEAFNFAGVCHEEMGNINDAKENYRKGTNLGNAPCQNNLGRLLEINKEVAEAYKYFKMAADQNHPDGLYNAARLDEIGFQGHKPDIDKAITMYKKSADLGNIYAMNNYAILKEEKDQLKMLKFAADHGCVTAMYNYLVLTHSSDSKLYRQVMNLGSIAALNNFACLTFQNSPTDAGKAMKQAYQKFLNRHPKQIDPILFNNYGLCQIYGWGVPKQENQGTINLKKAADQSPYASFNTAECFLAGKGFAQNIEQAVIYYNKAGDLPEAKQRLKAIQ